MAKQQKIAHLLLHAQSLPTPPSLPTELRAYLALFEQQLYYEAHDILESLWLQSKNSTPANFYKALIQVAGAFVHLQKNFLHPNHLKHATRVNPADRLLALAYNNLLPYPTTFLSFNLPALLDFIQSYRKSLQPIPPGTNPWSPTSAPSLLPFISSTTSPEPA